MAKNKSLADLRAERAKRFQDSQINLNTSKEQRSVTTKSLEQLKEERQAKQDSYADVMGNRTGAGVKTAPVRFNGKNQVSVSDQIRKRNADNQAALDAIEKIRAKSAADRSKEDINNLPEGAFDYVENNRNKSILDNAIYNATKNNKAFDTINKVADMKRDNVSALLQSQYNMDKEKADYYQRNWNTLSANKKEADRETASKEALANMSEEEYNLLYDYSKAYSGMSFNTNASVQRELLKDRAKAKEKLQKDYNLSEEEISKLADIVNRDANKRYNDQMKESANSMIADRKTKAGKIAAGALLSGESLAVAPLAGIGATSQAILSKLTGNPIDVYDNSFLLNNLQNNAQQAVNNNIDNGVARFLYNAVMSFIESRETMAIGGNLGSFLGVTGKTADVVAKLSTYPLFSSNAFASSLRDKKEEGLNDEQAFTYAVSAGIAEGLFEELSFDKLQKMSKLGKVGLVQTIKQVLKQGFYEGTEEINTDIANAISDSVINADYSDYNMSVYNYINAGYDPEKAKEMATKDFSLQLIEDGLAGALSGILGGAQVSFVNYHRSNRISSTASNETLQKAVDAASNSEIAKDSTAKEIADKLSAEGKTVENLSDREKRQLIESLSQLQDEEISNAISSRLSEKITNEDTLEKANVLFDEYRNSDMTDNQFEEKLVNEVAKNSEERDAILSVRDNVFSGENMPITESLQGARVDRQLDMQNKALEKEIARQDKAAEKQYAKFEKATTSKEKYIAAKGVASITAKLGNENVNTKALKINSLRGENSGITLEGGKSVALKNVTFADANYGKLYNEIASTLSNVDLANKVLQNYQGQPVESYVKAYNVVYELGRQAARTKKDANWLLNNALDSYIVSNMGGASVASEVFYQGKNAAEKYKKVKETVNGKTENKTYKNKSNAEKIRDTDSEIKDLLAAISEKTGVEIKEINAIKDNDGNYNTALLGSFFDNVITLNIEGKNEVQTLLHEVMEKMKSENQEGYNLIVAEVIDYVQSTKGSEALIDNLTKYQKAYGTVEGYSSTEDIADEYTNDFVAGILTSPEGLKDLAKWASEDDEKKAKNLFEAIEELFYKILDAISTYMDSHKANMNLGTKDGFEATGKRIEALRQTVLNELDKMGKESEQVTEQNKKSSYSINVEGRDVDCLSDVLTIAEHRIFMSEIDNHDKDKYQKTNNGDVIIPIKNKLVYTDFSKHDPGISAIIVFNTDSEKAIDGATHYIFDAERGITTYGQARRIIENYFGKEFDSRYTNKDFGSNSRYDRQYERGKSRSDSYHLEQQQRRKEFHYRNAETKNLLKYKTAKQIDNLYFKVLNDNDIKLANDIVRVYAEKQGYNTNELYVSKTNDNKAVDDTSDSIIFATNDKELAKENVLGKSDLLPVYSNTKSFYKINAKNNSINKLNLPSVLEKYGKQIGNYKVDVLSQYSMNDIAEMFNILNIYDGIVFKNVNDNGIVADYYVFFNKNNIKSASTVTYDNNGDVIPLSERFDNSVKDSRFSVDVDSEETKELANKAEEYYGITNKWYAGAYLTTNGNLLNFDEYDGGYREDHNHIEDIMEGFNRGEAVYEFLKYGNIRLLPEYGGINLTVKPNKAQRDKLKEFIYHFNGAVTVDYCKENGSPIGSSFYKEKTSPIRVLNDIDSFFNTGEVPEGNSDGKTFYSVSVDSDNNLLSDAQIEYFKDSKVRNENGNLLVMYHGTPNATFTKFKPGTYFTSNKEYADKYQSPTASSISTKRTVDNPDTYKVYLNITKPFDTRLPEVRKIWDEQYYHKWDTGELTDEGILDWTAVEGVRDFIEENELDFDGIIADEGSTGGYGEEVSYRGLSYIVMNASQVKNVDNVNPTNDPDIRYSIEIPDYNFSDTVAFTGSDEEIEAAEQREKEIQDFFKGIIEQPDFKALRYKMDYGNNQYHLLHRSTYPGVDYQLSSYDDKGGIGHTNYYKWNIEKLYQDLAIDSLWLKNRSVEVLPEDIETRKFQVDIDDELALFESIIAENDEIKEANNVIKNTVMSVGKLNIKPADIRKIASGIKTEYKMNTSVDDIADALTSVFNYMNQDNVNYDALVQIMSEIAKPLLENATTTTTQTSEVWESFRKYLSTTKFRLSPAQVREVVSTYGDTENYRKKLFGVTTVSREAESSLDEVWSELVDASGNTLPALVSDVDQPIVLLQTIDGLRPHATTENTYGMNLEEASYDLALDIYRRFFEAQAMVNKAAEIREAVGKVKTKQIQNRRKSVEKYKVKLAEQKKLLEAEKKKNIKALADEIKDSDEALQTALAENDEVAAAIIEDLKNKNNRKIEQIRKQKDEQIAKIKAKNFDSRKNERDRKKNTVLKEQLRNQTNALNKMLKSPNVAGFVKASMVRGTIDVLEAINLDTGKSQGMKEKLSKLSELYERYKTDTTFNFDYDENTSDMIKELRDTFENRNYTELSNEELQRVVELVIRLKTQIQNANKLLQNEKYQDAAKAATDIISEVNASKGSLDTKTEKNIDKYLSYQLNAYRWFRKTAGYKDDGALMNIYEQLDNGQMKMIQMQKEINDMFAPLLLGKENQAHVKRLNSIDEKDLVDIGLKVNGKPFKVTRGMLLSYLMHVQNMENARHMVLGGFTLPDLKLYSEGKIKDAFEKTVIGEFYSFQDIKDAADGVKTRKKDAGFEDGVNAAIKVLQGRSKKLRNSLDEWELSYLETAEKLFHEYYGQKINEVSVETRGYALAQTKNYYPIKTDRKFTRTEFAALKQDGSLEGLGFLKERVKASNPIMLEDISNVILRQTDNTSRYYGLSVPVRNVNMVMNMKFNNRTSPESAISSKWGDYNLKLFEKIMQDVQTGRGSDEGLAQVFTALRGNFAAATLTANIGVAMKQAASYPTAAAVLGWTPIRKAFKDIQKGFTNKGIEELEAINPLLWYRSKGQSSADINYAKQSDIYKYLDEKAPMIKAISVDLIQNIDSATVRTLEYASKYYVDENFKNLEKGSEEYWNKVSETFTKVIELTQPNYTVLQRPEVLKDTNALVRQLFMFKTQPLQNLGIIYDALGEYNVVSKKYKKDSEEYRKASRNLANAISSQIVAAAVFSAMTVLSNVLYHKLWKYDQDDDKSIVEEMLLAFAGGIATTLSGMLIAADWICNLIAELFFGAKNYGVSVSIVEGFNNTMSYINNYKEYGEKLVEAKTEAEREKYLKKLIQNSEDVAVSIGQYLGVPVNNLKNTFAAPYLYIKDIVTGVGIGNSQLVWDEAPESQYMRIFEALIDGNTERYNKLLNEQIKASTAQYPEKTIKNRIKTMIKESYTEKEISADDVLRLLNEAGIEYEGDIIDEWDYKNETGSSTYSQYSRMYDAINDSIENGADRTAIKTQINTILNNGTEKSAIASRITSKYKPLYLENKTADMKNLLISCYMYCGYTREEAVKKIENWK